jgi:uncharacterized protein (TIGR02217 family)
MTDYFDDTVLPTGLAYATSAAADFRTQIIETGSGFEYRNSPWGGPRRTYRFAGGPQKLDRLIALKQFFEARNGKLRGFLLRDWSDFSSAEAPHAISDGDQSLTALDAARTAFALQKTYLQSGRSYARRIVKPKIDTLMVARQGTRLKPSDDYTVDSQTGAITLKQALDAGEALTAGFEFYVPVRFDADRLEITRLSDQVGQIGGLSMVELNLGLASGG